VYALEYGTREQTVLLVYGRANRPTEVSIRPRKRKPCWMASRSRGPVSSLGQTTSLTPSTARSTRPPPPLHASTVTCGNSVRSIRITR
jgi:hypothetical protein